MMGKMDIVLPAMYIMNLIGREIDSNCFVKDSHIHWQCLQWAQRHIPSPLAQQMLLLLIIARGCVRLKKKI